MNNYKKYVAGAVAAITIVAMALPAFAQSNDGPKTNLSSWPGRPGMMAGQFARGGGMAMHPGVFGTVTAVNGSSITVNGRIFPPGQGSQASTTYSVDATNATVVKNNATSTLSNVLVGDSVFVTGTVTGTNVVAASIRDGLMPRGWGKGGPKGPGMMNGTSTSSMFSGNGQPVVAGTVASVNGASLSITTTSNITYSIDTSSAKIVKGNSTITVSGISVGDYVVVQGAINGTSVVASSVIDQESHTNGAGMGAMHGPSSAGFFGAIGQFFKHIFGF